MSWTKWSRQRIILAFILTLVLVGFAGSSTRLWAKPATFLADAPKQALEYEPPSRGAPGERKDGGRRPFCPVANKPFTTLVPATNWGETVAEHPTFWLYVPYQSGSFELVLHDEENNQKDPYRTKFQVTKGHPENCVQDFPSVRTYPNNMGNYVNLASPVRINRNMGEYELAIECYQQGLAIKWEIHNRLEAESINFPLRHYPIEYQQSLAVAREIKYPQMEGAALGNLGDIYFGLGDYAKAIEYYQQSLAVARDIKSRLGEGMQLNNLGAALYKSGNFAAAEKALFDAIKVWEYLWAGLDSNDVNKVSIFEEQARTYSTLQQVFISQDKPNDALVIAEQEQTQAFVELVAGRLSTNQNAIPDINKPSIERIKQIAKAQNATLIEYSITVDDIVTYSKFEGREIEFVIPQRKLFIWVIQPTGKVSFRQVDLGSSLHLEALVHDAVRYVYSTGTSAPEEVAFSPGDLVKLKDDVPKWEPWEVVTFEPKKRIVKLRQSSFPLGVTIERSVTDVADKVESRHTDQYRLQELHQLLIEAI